MPRTVLLTGATGAIGTQIAEKLAKTSGVRTVLACRDRGRGERLAARLSAVGGAAVQVETVDVASRRDVGRFAKQWRGSLDVLINNAAVGPVQRGLTDEGLERVFATNIMAYLWLAEGMRGALSAADSPRVINVASYWAGDLELEDLQFERRRYDNNTAYRQSKQANRMLTRSFARRYADDGIGVYSCHPGDVSSRLSNDLGFGGSMTAEQAARTPYWLATSSALPGSSGDYYANSRRAHCEFASDEGGIAQLDEYCGGFL